MSEIKKSKRDEVQAEAFDTACKHKRCGLGISVGVGKTFIALRHMRHLFNQGYTKFLVVGPKKSVFKTWQDEINKHGFTDLELCEITYVTYRSINKMDPSHYDAVYLDECHNILESHLPFLSSYTGRILGLSGTPPRYKNSTKGKLIQIYCPIRYEYIIDDAVGDAILNDYSIIVHEVELDTRKNFKVKTKKMEFVTTEVANYDYHNKRIGSTYGKQQMFARIMRMKAMMEYGSKEEYAKSLMEMIDDKCIVFCNTTDQADRLCKTSYHSKNPDSVLNLEKFNSGEADKLSCVLQLSEGINIPDLKVGIILHAYGNEKKLMQRLGRLMRLAAGEKAIIHILMFKNTQDETWVENALKDLDQSKITYYAES